MKLALHTIDEQIREVENRLAVERIALQDAMHHCKESLRETVTSPKTLLTLAGVGFTVGKVLFREKKPQPQTAAPVKKAGVLGLLTGVAGTALSLANARSGWGGIARWAAGRYFARRKGAQATARPGAATPVSTRPVSTTPLATTRISTPASPGTPAAPTHPGTPAGV
jgi:hypothetical protein